jgi:hypothetical protein
MDTYDEYSAAKTDISTAHIETCSKPHYLSTARKLLIEAKLLHEVNHYIRWIGNYKAAYRRISLKMFLSNVCNKKSQNQESPRDMATDNSALKLPLTSEQ